MLPELTDAPQGCPVSQSEVLHSFMNCIVLKYRALGIFIRSPSHREPHVCTIDRPDFYPPSYEDSIDPEKLVSPLSVASTIKQQEFINIPPPPYSESTVEFVSETNEQEQPPPYTLSLKQQQTAGRDPNPGRGAKEDWMLLSRSLHRFIFMKKVIVPTMKTRNSFGILHTIQHVVSDLSKIRDHWHSLSATTALPYYNSQSTGLVLEELLEEETQLTLIPPCSSTAKQVAESKPLSPKPRVCSQITVQASAPDTKREIQNRAFTSPRYIVPLVTARKVITSPQGLGMLKGLEEQGRSSQASSQGLPSLTSHTAGQSGHQGSPALAIRHLLGMGIGQYQARKWEHGQAWLWGTPGLAWHGRAVGGWTLALLQHCWGAAPTALVLLLGRVREPQGPRQGPAHSDPYSKQEDKYMKCHVYGCLRAKEKFQFQAKLWPHNMDTPYKESCAGRHAPAKSSDTRLTKSNDTAF
ncbi:hypothetical protein EK904_007272 [Melospiza melodia maxima]|nr:hypothetical protein EK904_007272 [Melospiza melodia maxima]